MVRLAVRLKQAGPALFCAFLTGCATISGSQERFVRQPGADSPPRALSIYAPYIMYAVWALGVVVSAIAGHYIVTSYIRVVRKYVKSKAKSSRWAALTGCIERVIYTTSFVLGWYTVIVVIFGIKIALFTINCLSLDVKDTAKAANSYILGNILSLGVAVLVGIIMKKILAGF
ncbi:MAG: hypothetical protein COS48_00535 [Candidatus Omnitrophica bacterium CG03_land_8_20_14_0_80_43_22]|nr:MAG: hypothetical protein COS48_00535 [Candidatus Omnitrophica bacterium CG03_land_8_20_14_0_80_43_22]